MERAVGHDGCSNFAHTEEYPHPLNVRIRDTQIMIHAHVYRSRFTLQPVIHDELNL